MKAKAMSDSLILFSVAGFVAWAFFQNSFVRSSVNANNETRLLFPIVVPILTGILLCIVYVIWLKHSPTTFLASSLRVKSNIAFLLISAVGLAIAYFLYTLLITTDSKNIAIIPILNTLFLVVIAFFVSYENDRFILKVNATPLQIIGAVITFVGVIIMKYGNSLSKR